MTVIIDFKERNNAKSLAKIEEKIKTVRQEKSNLLESLETLCNCMDLQSQDPRQQRDYLKNGLKYEKIFNELIKIAQEINKLNKRRKELKNALCLQNLSKI